MGTYNCRSPYLAPVFGRFIVITPLVLSEVNGSRRCNISARYTGTKPWIAWKLKTNILNLMRLFTGSQMKYLRVYWGGFWKSGWGWYQCLAFATCNTLNEYTFILHTTMTHWHMLWWMRVSIVLSRLILNEITWINERIYFWWPNWN